MCLLEDFEEARMREEEIEEYEEVTRSVGAERITLVWERQSLTKGQNSSSERVRMWMILG